MANWEIVGELGELGEIVKIPLAPRNRHDCSAEVSALLEYPTAWDAQARVA